MTDRIIGAGTRRAQGLMDSVIRDSSRSPPNLESSKDERPSAYDENFEWSMIKQEIYPPYYQFENHHVPPEPTNLDQIEKALARRRKSLTSADAIELGHRCLVKCAREESERAWWMAGGPITMMGEHDHDFKWDAGVTFNNLEPLTKNLLIDGKPYIFDSASEEEVDESVLDGLNKLIVPTTYGLGPVAPNFFFETRRPNASSYVADLQAMHHGALGARAMHSLQNYGLESWVYDNRAYTLTSTYHGGTLKIYAHHVVASVSKGPGCSKYFMTEVGTYGILKRKGFVEGITAFRNARDLAKSLRDQLIQEANARASLDPSIGQPIDVFSSQSHISESKGSTGSSDEENEGSLKLAKCDRDCHDISGELVGVFIDEIPKTNIVVEIPWKASNESYMTEHYRNYYDTSGELVGTLVDVIPNTKNRLRETETTRR